MNDVPVPLAMRKTRTWLPFGVHKRAPEARPSTSCCIVRREVLQQSGHNEGICIVREEGPAVGAETGDSGVGTRELGRGRQVYGLKRG